MLEKFLKSYVEECQGDVENFEYDSNSGSILSFGDPNLQVIAEPNENEVWLHCALHDIPLKNREKFYEALLTSQAFGQLTKGAHFSLDLNESKVLLCRHFSLESTGQTQFNQNINEFWEACLVWLATLERLSQ